jgi:hypothetical protein
LHGASLTRDEAQLIAINMAKMLVAETAATLSSPTAGAVGTRSSHGEGKRATEAARVFPHQLT